MSDVIHVLVGAYATAEDIQYEESSDRAMMRALPEEEKAKINQEVRLFRIEKEELDREISKWDDSGNDIVVLAKRMCMIMMEMTDFTRGRGPLKNTMDVINAAKRISECGQSLDKLCKDIANEVPLLSSHCNVFQTFTCRDVTFVFVVS